MKLFTRPAHPARRTHCLPELTTHLSPRAWLAMGAKAELLILLRSLAQVTQVLLALAAFELRPPTSPQDMPASTSSSPSPHPSRRPLERPASRSAPTAAQSKTAARLLEDVLPAVTGVFLIKKSHTKAPKAPAGCPPWPSCPTLQPSRTPPGGQSLTRGPKRKTLKPLSAYQLPPQRPGTACAWCRCAGRECHSCRPRDRCPAQSLSKKSLSSL